MTTYIQIIKSPSDRRPLCNAVLSARYTHKIDANDEEIYITRNKNRSASLVAVGLEANSENQKGNIFWALLAEI